MLLCLYSHSDLKIYQSFLTSTFSRDCFFHFVTSYKSFQNIYKKNQYVNTPSWNRDDCYLFFSHQFFIGLLMILLLQIVAGILGAVYKSQVFHSSILLSYVVIKLHRLIVSSIHLQIEGVVNQTLQKEIGVLQIASTNDKDILEGFHKLEIKAN